MSLEHQLTRWKMDSLAHRSIEWQDEAALGIILCGSTVAPVPPALQVLKAVVGVVQHCCLLTCLLSVNTSDHEPNTKLGATEADCNNLDWKS